MSPADNAAKEPSMDEILASIRRIIEDNDASQAGSVRGAFDQESVHDVMDDQPKKRHIDPAIQDYNAHHQVESASKVDIIPMEEPDHSHSVSADDKSRFEAEVAAFNEALSDSDAPMDALQTSHDTAPMNALSKMLSAQAAERVSASFGQLTQAVDANRGSQMQDMTEKMLKPLLQDWLDNNLPVIVERLVREEIERLARGEI